MKKLSLALAIAGLGGLFACKKAVQEKSEYPFVYLNHCFNQTYASDQIELCFNSVVSDSRCPINVNCIWQGTAVAKFTFTKNAEPHPLTLATTALHIPYAKDTIVDGYKIEFVNLHPYPVSGHDAPAPAEIKAEVKITKL